jgi:cyclopropane fatty-acyl-phospholipid synthase-like methyltransferase
MLPQAFDMYAETYDAHFTHSLIGVAQRKRVFRLLHPQLKKTDAVLEVNCGTGADAISIAPQVNKIVATDVSTAMIAVAKRKQNAAAVNFQVCNAITIDAMDGKFDTVFSNFGGLNCLSEKELMQFSIAAHSKLSDKGKMILVMMSSNCLIEKLYFKSKGRSFRRVENKGVETTLDKEIFLTYYYSPAQLRKIFNNEFKQTNLKPIGFFIPPSYMESKMIKYKWLFKLLVTFEGWFIHTSWLANRADHFYITFEKK